MTTTSTANLYRQLNARLLDFAPASGDTLSTRLDGRLYNVQAPDDVTYPYGVMRLMSRITDGAYNGDRETAALEVLLYDRPRSQLAALEDAADVCDQAMLRYVDATSGLTFSRERSRDTLPVFPEPADREVCAIRLVYPLVVWPVSLTQYGDFA